MQSFCVEGLRVMHSNVSDARRHLDLALRFLEEGKVLVDKDPRNAKNCKRKEVGE
jgi:hypothetical protein